MIGDGVVIDLADRTFLGADHAGEITKVIDRQREVGGARLADRFAVVPGLGDREALEIFLHAIGDPVQDRSALGDTGARPRVLGGVRRVEGCFDVLMVGARDLADDLAVHRRGIVEIPA